MKMVEERRKKIELGVKGGEMAQAIIKKAEEDKAGIIREADGKAVSIISGAEKTAQKKAQEIALRADKKAQDALRQAMLLAERKEKEEMERVGPIKKLRMLSVRPCCWLREKRKRRWKESPSRPKD